MSRVLLSVALFVGVMGCSRHAGTPDANVAYVPDAAVPSTPDAATVVSPLTLTLRGDLPNTGTWSSALDANAPTPIQKADTLTVVSNVPLIKPRIRLFDEADRVAESDDETQDPSTYRMHLKAPLLAGHRYALVIDGERPDSLADSSGRLLDELRFELSVEGEREKPAAPAAHPKRRHSKNP